MGPQSIGWLSERSLSLKENEEHLALTEGEDSFSLKEDDATLSLKENEVSLSFKEKDEKNLSLLRNRSLESSACQFDKNGVGFGKVKEGKSHNTNSNIKKGVREQKGGKSQGTHRSINKDELNRRAQILKLKKKTVQPASSLKDSLSNANLKKDETPDHLDSNRLEEEYGDKIHMIKGRYRHSSETTVKEPCMEPVEHEEYEEKCDRSKEKDDVLHQISSHLQHLYQQVETRKIEIEDVLLVLKSLTCKVERTIRKGKKCEIGHLPLEDNKNFGEDKKYLIQEDKETMKDDMNRTNDIAKSLLASLKEQEYLDTNWQEPKQCKENINLSMMRNVGLEKIDDKKDESMEVDKIKIVKEENYSDEKSDEMMEKVDKVSEKDEIREGVMEAVIEEVLDRKVELGLPGLNLTYPVTQTQLYKTTEGFLFLKAKRSSRKCRKLMIVDASRNRCSDSRITVKRRYRLVRKKWHHKRSGGGLCSVDYRPKGDNSNLKDLHDSNSDQHNSQGSQKSDDQEETEKERRGRDEDDEKDRDEHEEPPVENHNPGNKENQVARNLEKINNFKYRRKHGHLPKGETQLSDILGLLLNETEETKVPPDIFEQINSCLMISMQVKNSGETTNCYICTHVSSLICHFGSCSKLFQQACTLCMTLFKLIQKHVATCGLSDSFTSDITCPVIICVKLKRVEFAAVDNAEKVWKKLKKNLARFAYPELSSIDDDAFGSIDSITSSRPLSVRMPRLSTASRPVLESIPETGGYKPLLNSKPKVGKKQLSHSEPIARKKSDGSAYISPSLPKRFQDEPLEQLVSMPQSRPRSITFGQPSRPTHLDISVDSTDYFGQEPFITQARRPSISETPIFDLGTVDSSTPISAESRSHLSLDHSGSLHNSLPINGLTTLNFEEAVDILNDQNEYYSMPGPIFGEEDRTTSLQHNRRKEVGERCVSLRDRPTGIPGIQDVVYGERSCMLQVIKIWYELKKDVRNGKKLDTREEGVILPAFKDRLKILKMRYSKNFQWVRLSHLGSGTSGKCHLAMDFNTDFKFCIKKIHISKFEVNEVEIWSELRHKNIVQLIGTLRRGEKIYLLSEFIDGGCLTETIMNHRTLNRRLSQWTALCYLKQILEALVYLKKKYVIHEDLKADNILVRSGTNLLAITDFGVARKLTSETDIRGATPSGSQIVFSPEKARGQGHGYKSDLWSAICVLVHMLTGYPPWVRKYPNIGALLYVIIEQNPDIPSHISVEVADLIKNGFNKDPSTRPGPEELLRHNAFKMLDGRTPDTYVSTLLSSVHQIQSSASHLNQQSMDLKLPCESDEGGDQDKIIEEIEEDLKSIKGQMESIGFVTKNEILEQNAQENVPLEPRKDSNKNNSSIDMRKLAIELGLSLPENVNIKEEDTPNDLYQEFLEDQGQLTLNDPGLEEMESSTEKHSSTSESSQSELDFELGGNSDLPKFNLLFPKEEMLTEEEKEQQKQAESIVEQYHDSILIHQLSRSGSQQNQSFDSSNNKSSENFQEKIILQIADNSKTSIKSSLDFPNLTVFNESVSTISSEKLTIKSMTNNSNKQRENIETEGQKIENSSSPENIISHGMQYQTLKVSISGDQQRPKSASPKLNFIEEEEDINEDHLFGSGEASSDPLETSTPLKGFPNISSGQTLMKKQPPNLHLDLSPATKRKQYAKGFNTSDPYMNAAESSNKSPLPPIQPYYTPQVEGPQPFVTNRLLKPKSTSVVGIGKLSPRVGGEGEISGHYSSPRSQQEEIDRLLEELSSHSGTDIQMSGDMEDHPKFLLAEDEDEEASLLYVKEQYLDNSPAYSHASRLIVHYKPGQTFTMEIPGLLVKQQWKEIIEKECSDLIHNMGVKKFTLLNSNKEVLDLQKTPSQGDLMLTVQEVDDTSSVPWYCEAGMII